MNSGMLYDYVIWKGSGIYEKSEIYLWHSQIESSKWSVEGKFNVFSIESKIPLSKD